jgi:hypothetical protein
MPLTLAAGQYRFVCSCPKGHFYEPFTLFRQTSKFEPHCWYCGGEGKVTKITDDKMEDLKFSYNWNNKLDGHAFSTIRLRNDMKYYVGAKKTVYLKDELKGTATVVYVTHILIAQINEAIARLDTGYPAEECKNIIKTMYKNKAIDWNKQQLCFCILAYNNNRK